MLPLISWRNIWRNKLRSAVVMLAIALGIWSGIFASSLMQGVNKQRNDVIIKSQLSHIQIHAPGFDDNYEVDKIISQPSSITDKMKKMPEVEAFSGRVISAGMAATASNGTGVLINGIDPIQEDATIGLMSKMVDGKYFEGIKRNPIFIGKDLADKLNVKVRKKIILSFPDMSGDIVSANFKVVGIYKSTDTRFDGRNVYVRKEDLAKLLGVEDGLHEIAVLLKNDDDLGKVAGDLSASFPKEQVQSWKQILPGLDMANKIASRMNYLLLLILLAAMSFGIVNTMLMAVLERVREIGMLMAVGMSKTRVFLMIMLETCFLMMIAAPLGMLIAHLSISYLGKHGINMSQFEEGFNAAGIESTIYPMLDPNFYFFVIGLVLLAAILASIYPAFKAISLRPAEAIRKL